MSHGRSNPRRPRAPAHVRQQRTFARSPVSQQHSLRIGPPTLDDAATWHARGVEHECAGHIHDAILCYRLALSAGGADTQVIFDLAYALASAGQPQAAIERYRQVVEANPQHADAWNNLGDLLIEEGEHSLGIDALRQAMHLDPLDPTPHYNLAGCLDACDAELAAEHWRAFIRLNPVSDYRVAYARERIQQHTESRYGSTLES